MNTDKIKPYLPSKKFQKTIGGFLVVGIFIIVVFFIFSSQKESYSNYNKNLKINDKTIAGLVQQDTDADGIPDWEEDLWGTDKNNKATFDGISDSTYVENKKKALNADGEVDNKTLTETDKFAREFFSAYSALSSEGASAEIIGNFSSALGQRIVNPNLENIYSQKDVKILKTETEDSHIEYYLKLQAEFNIYKENGIGDELEIISQELLAYTNKGATTAKSAELLLIGEAYQEFAKKIIQIEVPSSLSARHLDIANSSHNTGVSVLSLIKLSDDPVVGISGLANYQKYSEEFIENVTSLETLIQ